MALTIPLEIAGTGTFAFTTAGSALAADQRITGGTGSIANTTLTVRIPSSANPPVTAYATGAAFSQTIAGAPIFTAQGQESSIFIFNSSQSYTTPVKLMGGNGATSGTIVFALTALGSACAEGVQTGTVTVTLSSYALSGNVNSTTIVLTAADTSPSASITVTAVPTASEGNVHTCDAEARRLALLGY